MPQPAEPLADSCVSAWLDEGINSYVEALAMGDAYDRPGSYADVLGPGPRHHSRVVRASAVFACVALV